MATPLAPGRQTSTSEDSSFAPPMQTHSPTHSSDSPTATTSPSHTRAADPPSNPLSSTSPPRLPTISSHPLLHHQTLFVHAHHTLHCPPASDLSAAADTGSLSSAHYSPVHSGSL